jgi:hypothetical protein
MRAWRTSVSSLALATARHSSRGQSPNRSAVSSALMASPTVDFVCWASHSAGVRCPPSFHEAESATRLAASILMVLARLVTATTSRTTISASDARSPFASNAWA